MTRVKHAGPLATSPTPSMKQAAAVKPGPVGPTRRPGLDLAGRSHHGGRPPSVADSAAARSRPCWAALGDIEMPIHG